MQLWLLEHELLDAGCVLQYHIQVELREGDEHEDQGDSNQSLYDLDGEVDIR